MKKNYGNVPVTPAEEDTFASALANLDIKKSVTSLT